MTIKELINKIKWSKKENPGDYELFYFDRVKDENIPFNFTDIKNIIDEFLIIEKDAEEITIPLHRIRLVRKKGITIWKR